MEKPVICAFDSLTETFVAATKDNRVKVWNTLTNRLVNELAEVKHLSHDSNITSLSWGCAPSQGGRGHEESRKETRVAVGMQKGSITVWDLLSGQPTPLDGHSDAVCAVVFNRSGSFAFSAAEDRVIMQWNMVSGESMGPLRKEKQRIYSMALSRDESSLYYGTTSLKMLDVRSKTVTAKFTGHGSPVAGITMAPSGNYALSSCVPRFMYLWNCKAKEESVDSFQTFTAEGAAVHIEFSSFVQEPNTLDALCVTNTGKVHVWRYKVLSDKKDSPIQPMGTFTSEFGIAHARFCSKTEIMLAIGDGSHPAFERMVYLLEGQVVGGQASVQATKLVATPARVKTEDKKAQVSVAFPTTMVSASPLGSEPGAKLRKAERTSEIELLKQLTNYTDEKVPKGAIPKADSLHVVLQQALQTSDKKLFEACLQVRDPEIVKNTVQRMPATAVIPLVQQLVARFQDKANQGTMITVWLRPVMLYHASYLMSVPDIVDTLSSLYLTLDSRLAMFNKLLKLSGRLDLLLAQVAMTEKVLVSPPEKKVTVYDEPEGDDGQESKVVKEDQESESEEDSEESDDDEEKMDE